MVILLRGMNCHHFKFKGLKMYIRFMGNGNKGASDDFNLFLGFYFQFKKKRI